MSSAPRNALPSTLLDWGSVSPLRLKAISLTEGLYSGVHRSKRRGSGIEFDGHRNYVPGDDLRRLDYRAMMRHGRLLVRQFETETERCLCLLVDASLSMNFKSARAPTTKYAYAALLAAALGRVAIATGDLLSLDWVGGETPIALPTSGGREAFERLVTALEAVRFGGDDALQQSDFDHVLSPVARRARRGAVVVLLSDLLDLPAQASEQFAALSNRNRRAVTVRVLDPVEVTFPFQGPVRLKGSYGPALVETDAAQARAGYLAALEAQRTSWQERLVPQGGRLVECQTDEAPIEVLRRILRAAESTQ
ncbi:MAG: hypothetical protein RJA70_909 [Pseudomonadota bacterium]|jgi:uncharacterized protein (DUF58 family)